METPRVPYRSGSSNVHRLPVESKPIEDYIGCPRGRIWFLGTKVNGFRSIAWSDSNVSFSDCDILVVVVETLTSVLDKLTKDSRHSLSHEIDKRFEQGDLLIICIVEKTISSATGDSNNYFWCPVETDVRSIGQHATRLKDQHETNMRYFQKYLDDVDQYKMEITYIQQHHGKDHPIDGKIETRSGDVVGCVCRVGVDDPLLQRKFLVMLHPLNTPEASVAKVLEVFNPPSVSEPSWAKNIRIPSTDNIEQKISVLDKEVVSKQKEINMLRTELNNVLQYRKLVYETGTELECVVEHALKLLKLQSIRRGEPGKEDFVFTPKTNSPYSMCSIEVKGIEGNLKIDHLRQLVHWVDDHFGSETRSKGIMIVNAFRQMEMSESRSRKSVIDNTCVDFAEQRKLCILHTPVLLDWCKRVLGGQEIPVDKIERILLNTNGVVRSNCI